MPFKKDKTKESVVNPESTGIMHHEFSDTLKDEIITAYFKNYVQWKDAFDDSGEDYYYNRAANNVVLLEKLFGPAEGIHFKIKLNFSINQFCEIVEKILGNEFSKWFLATIPEDFEEEGFNYFEFSPDLWGIFKSCLAEYPDARKLPANVETITRHAIAEEWLKKVNGIKTRFDNAEAGFGKFIG